MLVAQLEEVRARLAELDPNNRNHLGEISRLKSQEAELLKMIEEQQEREQKQEEKINGEITFAVDGVDFTQLPAEVIKLINIVVKHDRRQLFEEQNREFAELQRKHREEIDELKDEAQNWQRQTREANERIAELQDEIHDLREELHQTKAERDDFAQRFRNATILLEEKDQEIERLQREIEDMKAAQERTYAESKQNVIAINPDPDDDLQALVNSIAAQFAGAEDWGSVIKVTKQDGTFEVVKRDVYERVLEQIEAPELPEVQPIGGSFRSESQTDTAADTQDGGVHPAEMDAVNFPDVEAATDGLAQEYAGVEMADQVSRAEFEALKKRVDHLYVKFNISEVA